MGRMRKSVVSGVCMQALTCAPTLQYPGLELSLVPLTPEC